MQKNLEILSKAINEWMPKDRPVYQAPAAAELEKILDLSIEQEGCNMQELESAIQAYLHYNPDVSQPEFFKLLYSGLNKPALLGDWISSLSNATMHTYQVGPVATLMELELIRQWNKLIGFQGDEGIMVSGGSQANLIGMMLARHNTCPDFKTQGAKGRTLVAFVSDQAHYSAQKAANVLGIGSNNLIAVASDDEGRILSNALQTAIEESLSKDHLPFFIGLTAGTTVTGSYDPIAACSKIARQYNIWMHIDGAWGGPILFSEKHRHLLADCHLADSFTWDAHKLMNVPITAAAILVRHSGALQACCSGGGGDYLFHEDENSAYNLGNSSIQCGRRADSLKVWLSWKATGHKGFAEKIDYLQSMKEYCLDIIKQDASLELLVPAAYLNVLFRYKPTNTNDEQKIRQLNIKICKTMMHSGSAYVDYAQFKGKTGIRLILANQDVSQSHLETLMTRCKEIGQELEQNT